MAMILAYYWNLYLYLNYLSMIIFYLFYYGSEYLSIGSISNVEVILVRILRIITFFRFLCGPVQRNVLDVADLRDRPYRDF